MLQKIAIKFEDKIYWAELPTSDNFTGELALVFHWKQGHLMKAEISKHSTVDIIEVDNSGILAEESIV